jgi:hypothetical protein
MSAAPYIVLFSLVAVAVAEAIAYIGMKGDVASTRRAQPE